MLRVCWRIHFKASRSTVGQLVGSGKREVGKRLSQVIGEEMVVAWTRMLAEGIMRIGWILDRF